MKKHLCPTLEYLYAGKHIPSVPVCVEDINTEIEFTALQIQCYEILAKVFDTYRGKWFLRLLQVHVDDARGQQKELQHEISKVTLCDRNEPSIIREWFVEIELAPFPGKHSVIELVAGTC